MPTHEQDYMMQAAQHAERENARSAEVGRAEVREAVARDARTDTRTVTPDELRDRALAAVRYALPGLQPDSADDLAQDVTVNVARRLGTWTPRRCDISRKLLALRAVTLWRDARKSARDDAYMLTVDAPHADAGDDDAAPTRTDFHAVALGEHLPATAVDADAVVRALDFPDDSPAADALRAALSGWKTAHDVAARYGITEGSAAVRLSKGRAAIRKRYTPDALVTALWDADAGELPLTVGTVPADSRPAYRCPITGRRTLGRSSGMLDRWDGAWNATPVGDDGRLRLTADARAMRRMLDALGLTTACLPHAASMTPDARTDDGNRDAAPFPALRRRPYWAAPPTRANVRRSAYVPLTGQPTTGAHRDARFA